MPKSYERCECCKKPFETLIQDEIKHCHGCKRTEEVKDGEKIVKFESFDKKFSVTRRFKLP